MSKSETWNRILLLQRAARKDDAQAVLDVCSSTLSSAELAECNGNQFFLARNFQEAVRCYEESIAIEPDHIIGRYQYLAAVQLEQKNDLVEAFKRYVACIEAEPSFPDAYTELGGLLMKVGDFSGAVRCYEDALAKDPDVLGNYQNLVTAYEKLCLETPNSFETELNMAKLSLLAAQKRLPIIPSGHSW